MPNLEIPASSDSMSTIERPSLVADIDQFDRYFRTVNYLAVAQVYLQSNVLLEEPLRAEHIKHRLLGHWGTCPGINLTYLHLNELIRREEAEMLLITGPGHGAAANLANMYVEGSLAEFYPELTLDRKGLHEFIKRFSWPGRTQRHITGVPSSDGSVSVSGDGSCHTPSATGGFPSHLTPMLPGVIHEGGELGYALATAFGAALDNPDLIVACIVGDGEAETGPTATAWHGTKFLNPVHDGAVLPILHLNGFKIANPSIFATMSDEELSALFQGYGYQVRIIDDLEFIHEQFAADMDWAYQTIREIQQAARAGEPFERPGWPMLILRTPKGWTGPREIDGHVIEGSFRSHQVPAKEAKSAEHDLKILEDWLRSYRPEELFEDGVVRTEIRQLCPDGEKRMAMNRHARGWERRIPLDLPPVETHAVEDAFRGGPQASSMIRLGNYLTEVVQRNDWNRNFRIVCPDELESNRIGQVLEATQRQYNWPIPEHAENLAPDGRVLEFLSEHQCQGWLQGYLLTGRHGLYPCYEAFIPIVDGMMNQYAKFMKSSQEVPWRGPVSSLNYLLTSTGWRQDHNGYSHQGPGFINNLLTKKGHTYRVYLPPDANTLLYTVDECLRSTDMINLIVADKQPMPQWLGPEEAREHCRVGASIWRWAGRTTGKIRRSCWPAAATASTWKSWPPPRSFARRPPIGGSASSTSPTSSSSASPRSTRRASPKTGFSACSRSTSR
jgi:xylulose-5-phosphate/fructose-6-phosphate phosphoketolase